MAEMDAEWLSGLTAGDEVLVSGRMRRVLRVDRVTPKQIIIGHKRYWKSNGYEVGASGFYPEHVLRATPEARVAIKAADDREWLAQRNWDYLPPAVVVGVRQFVETAFEAERIRKAGA